MKINYDLKFKEELEKIKGTKPTLLLHVCCGPCSGNVLKEISEFFDITIYYSNSNIYPDTEYFRRFHELENFIQRFNQDFNQNIQVVEKEYQPKEYLKDISQYKDEPEGGKRCYLCYSKRMKDAYDYASLHHFDYWTTVLSVYLKSVKFATLYNLYRQNYCGCIYSYQDMLEREKNKELQK